jgi:four helix bundle protein
MVDGGASCVLPLLLLLRNSQCPVTFGRDFYEILAGTGSALSMRMATNSFRDLEVWQEAMLLVEDIYRLSARFPGDERFGLTAQLRKASVSIPSNIGEGARRKRNKAYLYFLEIALGSQGEVDVQAELAKRLGFCSPANYDKLVQRIDRIGRMLNGLISSLQPDDESS